MPRSARNGREGTASRRAAFAALSCDGLERLLPDPAGYTGICWYPTVSLARVLGRGLHPAFCGVG